MRCYLRDAMVNVLHIFGIIRWNFECVSNKLSMYRAWISEFRRFLKADTGRKDCNIISTPIHKITSNVFQQSRGWLPNGHWILKLGISQPTNWAYHTFVIIMDDITIGPQNYFPYNWNQSNHHSTSEPSKDLSLLIINGTTTESLACRVIGSNSTSFWNQSNF